jgi:hypothetical protein
LRKQKYLFKKHETKMTCCGLKYLNKLVIIKEKEKKEHEKETRQEAQLPVSTSKTLVPANTP